MNVAWPPNIGNNTKWYHDIADQFNTFQDRYTQNLENVKARGGGQIGAGLKSLSQSEGKEAVGNLVESMVSDADQCYKIAQQVVAWRQENFIRFRDNDPGHQTAFEWWENKERAWLGRREELEPYMIMYG